MPDPNTPETPADPNQTPEEKQGTSAQDRINLLTRKRHDAERQAEAANSQLAVQADQLAALQAQVQRLTAPPPPVAPPAQSPTSPFGQPQPVAPATGAIDPAAIQAMVASAVRDAIAPVTQSVTANARAQRHQVSFAETARQLPQLADANSELHQTFQEIWASRPDLQELDDGVTLAAYAAQGVVGARPAAPTPADKTAAAVNAPRAAPRNILPQGGNAAQAQELADKLQAQGQAGGLDTGGWEALISAELAGKTPE